MPKMPTTYLVQELSAPHGDDLIPLSSKTQAQLFVKRFGVVEL